jgi:hypothetical protein
MTTKVLATQVADTSKSYTGNFWLQRSVRESLLQRNTPRCQSGLLWLLLLRSALLRNAKAHDIVGYHYDRRHSIRSVPTANLFYVMSEE